MSFSGKFKLVKLLLLGGIILIYCIGQTCSGSLVGNDTGIPATTATAAGSAPASPVGGTNGDGTPCIAADGRMNPLGGGITVNRTSKYRGVESGLFRTGDDAVRVNADGTKRNHYGIDLSAPVGTPVYAVSDGVADYGWTGNLTGYGTTVTICTGGDDPMSMLYAHLSSSLVSPGQQIRKGQIIGYTGVSGNAQSTSPHLHFEVRKGQPGDKRYVDPLPYLNGNVDMETGSFLNIEC